MSDTWRIIIVVTLLVCLGGLLPFAADEYFSPPIPPVAVEGGAHG